jgi:membrane-associated phospholipid phosphatase
MLTIDTRHGSRANVRAHLLFEEKDVALGAELARQKDDPIVRALGALSEAGDQPPLAILSGTVLTYGLFTQNRRAIEAGARMLGSLLLASALKTGLKKLVARTRPNVLLGEGCYAVEALGPDEGPWQSFPSGHTAGSVAVARAVSRVYPGARGPSYAGAAAIGLVQVPRGAHFPADVAAGMVVGLIAEATVDAISGSGRRRTRC